MTYSQNPSKDISIKIHKLTFLMDRIAVQTLREGADLTFAQYRLLRWLQHAGQISQKKIANFHGLTAGAVSRQIDPLVEKKWISRTVNPKNRRERRLTLTHQGAKKAATAGELLDAKFSDLFKVLNPRQKDALRQNLDALLDAIWEKGKILMCGFRTSSHHVSQPVAASHA
ncbi:MAG: MarR family transcriptional regulator [Candidatus Kerfeldbacteria bacterium]|nr:MarR family transcriptional regulator [Candidatus Kerfeldbacteria bacterium]